MAEYRGSMYAYFKHKLDEKATLPCGLYDFGSPDKFIPQKQKVTEKIALGFLILTVVLIFGIILCLNLK